MQSLPAYSDGAGGRETHAAAPHGAAEWPASRFQVQPREPIPAITRTPDTSANTGALRRGRRRAVALGAAALLTAGAAGGAGLTALSRGAPVATPRGAPLAGPLTYAAIGASDAAGFGVAVPRREGWVPQLARQLPQPVRLVNLGVPGSTLRDALTEQLPRAPQAEPDLVTVWLVVKDVLAGVSPTDYAADLDRLLGELRSETDAVIAVANAPFPPAALDPWGMPDVARRAVALTCNAIIGRATRTHGAVLVDLYARWPLAQHPDHIGPDGLHPTAAGYRALADAFLATLRQQRVV